MSKQPVQAKKPDDVSAHAPTNISPGSPDPHASPKHLKLCSELVKRGAVEGLIDLSSGKDDVKDLELAVLVHAEPSKVIAFFLSETNVGKFRRHVICDYAGENK